MFATWGTIVSKGRWTIVALTVAFLAVAGIWGTSVFGQLSGSSSLDDPSSESQRAGEQIEALFGKQSFDVIGVYTTATGTVADPAVEAAVTAGALAVREIPRIGAVLTAYETGSPSMVSTDQRSTFVAVRYDGDPVDGQSTRVSQALRDAAGPGITVQIGGQRIVDNAIGDQIPADIAKAEAIATPILLLALLVVFGSVTSALMPLMVGAVSVLGAFLIVRVITMFTEVSIFAMNIITILGLGLAIDYGLFIVNRFREELAAQRARGRQEDPVAAVQATLATAGRTVLISGLLVTLALCGLLMFPQVFLRSMGFGGAAAVGVAMITSLTLLPAVLVLLGHRIDGGRMPWVRRRQARVEARAVAAGAVADGDHEGWWARAAARVLRYPVACLVASVAVLGILAAPFAGVHFGGVDARMLPADSEPRIVAEELARDFPGGSSYPIRVLLTGTDAASAATFGDAVAAVPGVQTTEVAGSQGEATLFQVTYSGEPSSIEAREVATAIRALEPPAGAELLVAGTPAAINDQLDSLAQRLPWMALLVAGLTFLVLAVGFGSILVPLKAIVMNLVSIGAAFGVVTWIFQDGNLSGWLDFTPTGYVEASQPVLMIAILFGLSMDYEVFLLSRIRERWDDGADLRSAVVGGVQSTGRMITAAAVLLCIVIGFFATSGITFIKMIGVGMVVAILVDATIVRLVMVPATMVLLGRWNWAAPRFLTRMYGRYGIREGQSGEPAPAGELSRQPAVPSPTR